MGLEKAIQYNKEKRKEYRGSKRFDRTCRNHGYCSYCRNNRTFSTKKRSCLKSLKEQTKDFFEETVCNSEDSSTE